MSFFRSNTPEKRQFKRLKTSLNAKFKIISGENPSETSAELIGIVTNISEDGLYLESGFVQIDHFHISHDSSMMKKNKLGIKLQLPQKDKKNTPDSIYILGEVVWYDKKNLTPEYPYHIGVKHIEISKDERLKLENLINNN